MLQHNQVADVTHQTKKTIYNHIYALNMTWQSQRQVLSTLNGD